MKKFIIALLTICLAITGLTGCESRIKDEIVKKQARNTVKDLDLTAFFDEENGYHFPGTTWGGGVSDVQKMTNDSLDSVVGYTGDNIVVYSAMFNYLFNGRKNSDATISFFNDYAYIYSILFEESEDGSDTVTNKEIQDKLIEELTRVYGEPTDTREFDEKSSSSIVTYKTYVWEYTTPDGKNTELQCASAYLNYVENPKYVSIGAVWMTDEIMAMDEESSEE